MIRRDGQLSLARKDERWQILQELAKELLTDFTKPIRVTLNINNEKKTFEFEVLNLVRQEKIRDIFFDFINGQTGIRLRDPIRVIETLFKQKIRNDFVCIKNKFYSRRQQLIDLIETTHAGRLLRYRVKGFGKSANQLTFNLRSDKDQTTTTTSMKSENELTFDDSNGYQSTIELKKSVSVAEYFTKKYKRLQYPNLPCVDARNGNEEKTNWLSMEVVKESSLRPLDSVQRALVSKTTIVKPDRRYDEIMKIVR
ncbi:unnamed protein product [Rotaria sordida]|uniref:PAZ domain-containing protein n=1 Tax=Rotaria sordida TaxID=392033 RepID=A0A814QDR1_9BILA|nr:unnamed protein product [Rotaria sordida]CAF1336468.1 unnamed protein product [Rotaria sordida]